MLTATTTIKEGTFYLDGIKFCSGNLTVTSASTEKTIRIKDYKVINDKVVIVYFEDGSKTKAVLDDRDTFDLGDAIAVCVHKKLLGDKYHSSVKDAMKQIKAIDKKKAEDKEIQEIIERKRAKRIEYKKRRAEKARQARIEEMSEAFAIGMQKYDEFGVDANLGAFNAEFERLAYLDQTESAENSNEEN